MKTEHCVAQRASAETFQAAKRSLEAKLREEAEKNAIWQRLSAALDAAQATIPKQESLGKEITELELQLPAYDE